jgi:hypothetical protein
MFSRLEGSGLLLWMAGMTPIFLILFSFTHILGTFHNIIVFFYVYIVLGSAIWQLSVQNTLFSAYINDQLMQ